MPIEEYVQSAWEEIVDVEYNMDKLVDFARGREIHLGLDLNDEPMEVPHIRISSAFHASV